MLYKAHRFGKHGACRRGGFTMVELLVVISIVGLLAAILSPSLKSARDQAKQVVCASRLKQWSVAFGCYTAENNGFLPHCDGLDRGPRTLDDPHIRKEDVADWHGWVDVLPPLIAYRPWRGYPFYQHPDEKTFYHCPWGRLTDGVRYGYKPDVVGYFSYAMNSCLELDNNAWAPPGGFDYPMPSFLNTARILCPQRVVLLFEQLLDPRKGFDGARYYFGAGRYCGSYPKSFSARHPRNRCGLGGNILYCDGHVEWQKSVWRPEWDVDQELPPRDDRNWYPYPAARASAR